MLTTNNIYRPWDELCETQACGVALSPGAFYGRLRQRSGEIPSKNTGAVMVIGVYGRANQKAFSNGK